MIKRPTTDNLQDWITAMDAQGMEMVDLRLAWEQLDLDEKPYLAATVQSYRARNISASEEKLKSLALADTNYRDYLRALALAHHRFLQAQVRYNSLCSAYEAKRTEHATQRAKINMGVFHEGR